MNGTYEYVPLGWKDVSIRAGEAIVLLSWGCGWIGGEGKHQHIKRRLGAVSGRGKER